MTSSSPCPSSVLSPGLHHYHSCCYLQHCHHHHDTIAAIRMTSSSLSILSPPSTLPLPPHGCCCQYRYYHLSINTSHHSPCDNYHTTITITKTLFLTKHCPAMTSPPSPLSSECHHRHLCHHYHHHSDLHCHLWSPHDHHGDHCHIPVFHPMPSPPPLLTEVPSSGSHHLHTRRDALPFFSRALFCLYKYVQVWFGSQATLHRLVLNAHKKGQEVSQHYKLTVLGLPP